MISRYLLHRDAPWLLLAGTLIGLLALGVWLWPERINHDCGLYLQQAELILDGEVPYVDFIDTNPPLVMYLGLPAAWMGRLGVSSPIGAYHGMVVLLLILSWLELYILLRYKKDIFRPAERGSILLAWIVFSLWIAFHGQLGQREHLFVLTCVPYLFLRIARYEGRSFWGPFAVFLGLQAGIGMALKPQFLFVVVVVELVQWLNSRRVRFLGKPENLAILFVLFVYALHWMFVPPMMRHEFFFRWLPAVLSGYGAYNQSIMQMIATMLSWPLGLFMVLITMGAFITGVRSQGSYRKYHLGLASFASMSLLIFFLQHKGWTYHAIPFLAASGLATVLLVIDGLSRQIRDRHAIKLACIVADWTFIGGWVVVAFTSIAVANAMLPPDRDAAVFDNLRNVVQENTVPGDRVMFITTSVRPAYPMLVQMKLKPGGRYLCCFPIAFFYGDASKAEQTIYRHKDEAPPAEQRFLAELSEDVRRNKPVLLITADSSDGQGLPTGFNQYQYLIQSGWASEVLQSYEELDAPPGWHVFKRRQ